MKRADQPFADEIEPSRKTAAQHGEFDALPHRREARGETRRGPLVLPGSCSHTGRIRMPLAHQTRPRAADSRSCLKAEIVAGCAAYCAAIRSAIGHQRNARGRASAVDTLPRDAHGQLLGRKRTVDVEPAGVLRQTERIRRLEMMRAQRAGKTSPSCVRPP